MKRFFAILSAVMICILSLPATADGYGIANAQKGTTVTFGHYPQTVEGTDQTPIEWQTLDVRNGKALLISRYSLDVIPYNTERAGVTWETCSLRAWLNSEFLHAAFTEEEQAMILLSDIPNGEKQHYSLGFSTGGKDTEDRLFVLSYAEAHQYLGVSAGGVSNNAWAQSAPTENALSKGAELGKGTQTSEGEASGSWWLRSPETIQSMVCTVNGGGKKEKDYVNSTSVSVRPAMWINLISGMDRTDLDRAEKIRPYSTIGNVVNYGHYEKNNNIEDGPEEIEWIVLDVQGSKALLISKYGLDSQPYNQDRSGASWKDCSLRKWLEEEFLPVAFSEEEQAAIALMDVDNRGERGDKASDASDGENTKDRIFLLSKEEADKYLVTIWKNTYNTKAGVIQTAYAEAVGADCQNMLYIDVGWYKIFPGWWWLRSTGERAERAWTVGVDGSFTEMVADMKGGCVRPTFWLDLDAAPF